MVVREVSGIGYRYLAPALAARGGTYVLHVATLSRVCPSCDNEVTSATMGDAGHYEYS